MSFTSSFDTQHTAPIHDAQLDYYGKRLATASADNTIRIWDVSTEQHSLITELRGHESSVLQVCWAHPKFGNILASCSFDRTIIIWREGKGGPGSPWEIIHKDGAHTSSVNAVGFSPWEFGLHLASASSDGSIAVHSYKGGHEGWSRKAIPRAHLGGVNALSWAPATTPSTLASGPGMQQDGALLGPMRLVSGGSDNQVKLWQFDESSGGWSESSQQIASLHKDWVRDVAWRPNVGIPSNTIAVGGEDKTLTLWVQEADGHVWRNQATFQVSASVWRVSWSVTGSVLAAALADNSVKLYKENEDHQWAELTTLQEEEEHSNNNSNNPTLQSHPAHGGHGPQGGEGGGLWRELLRTRPRRVRRHAPDACDVKRLARD